MTRARLLLVVVCALVVAGCAHSQKPAAAPASGLHIDYRVRLLQDPLALEVTLSFEGEPAAFLFTRPGGVAQVQVQTRGGDHTVSVGADGRVELPKDARGLRYRYLLDLGGTGHFGDLYTGAGDANGLLVAGRSYLIRPRVADGVTATLRVEGADALLPWAPKDDGSWQLDGVALVDSGFHGFNGRRCTRQVETTTLEVSLLGGRTRVPDAFLCDWVTQAAMEALTLQRPLPHTRLTVHLLPIPSDEASVLGLLLWSTPPSLALTVGEEADESAFGRDWVALHELVHVLHPSFPGQAPWLSEGLSTYLTEVARMRSGRHTEAEGWAQLSRGFARGRGEAGDWTLDESVAGMRRGVYLPVYWAGALICLDLDVTLRQATGGEHALEDVLKRLADEGPTSTLVRFGEVVDALAGRELFAQVLARHLKGPVLAPADQLLEALGVRSSGDGVTLVEAPLSPVRQAISTD